MCLPVVSPHRVLSMRVGSRSGYAGDHVGGVVTVCVCVCVRVCCPEPAPDSVC